MFYYCLDYIKPIRNNVIFICRKRQESWLHENLDSVKTISLKKALFDCLRKNKQTFIYSPTPHPIPLIKNQIITIHDDYPFRNGLVGFTKKTLLKLGLIFSSSKIAYVNRSNAKNFVLKLRIRNDKIFYAPNFFPIFNIQKNKIVGNNLRVGLVGTDSKKKNYDRLFKHISVRDNFEFYVYGLPTSYIKGLIKSYPALNIKIIDSRNNDILYFMNIIDVVVSIAKDEGFGRPIAMGISIGRPTLLIKCQPFIEFYGDLADMYEDEIVLIQALRNRTFKDVNISSESLQNQDFHQFQSMLIDISGNA